MLISSTRELLVQNHHHRHPLWVSSNFQHQHRALPTFGQKNRFCGMTVVCRLSTKKQWEKEVEKSRISLEYGPVQYSYGPWICLVARTWTLQHPHVPIMFVDHGRINKNKLPASLDVDGVVICQCRADGGGTNSLDRSLCCRAAHCPIAVWSVPRSVWDRRPKRGRSWWRRSKWWRVWCVRSGPLQPSEIKVIPGRKRDEEGMMQGIYEPVTSPALSMHV